jgi:hypothetical protein
MFKGRPSNRLVPHLKEFHLRWSLLIRQSGTSLFDGLPLNIEPEHTPTVPYRLCKHYRVVPVSHRRVDGHVARVERSASEHMRKVENGVNRHD